MSQSSSMLNMMRDATCRVDGNEARRDTVARPGNYNEGKRWPW